MATDVLTSLNFLDSPTVNGAPVLSATPGVYSGFNINADGTLVSSGGVTPTNQILAFYSGSTGALSGTSVIPSDNTLPAITEGTQVWGITVTPVNAGSKFKIEQSFRYDCGTANRNIVFAVFRGNTCIGVTCSNLITSGRPLTASILLVDSPNTASSITYSLRVGVSSAATWYINQSNGGTITFGGAANASQWCITEIL